VSFHSRKDDVINSSGYRIGPAEIEECLAGHDAVADAGVIGVPDEMRGEVPKAFVVLAEGNEATDELSEALRSHVESRLAKYERPRELEFVSELPTTTTGKVRRHDLRVREGLTETE
jgi:acetyl-CoA synthetase